MNTVKQTEIRTPNDTIETESLCANLRKFLEMMSQREEADKRQQNKTKGSCAFIVKSGTLEEASLERALE